MNSIERVTATIKGEERDRPPISLTLSLYGAKLTNCPLSEYYSDPKKYVDGQIAVYNEIGPDIIFGPFALSLFGKAFGSEVRFFDNQAPNLKKPIIDCTDDLDGLDFEKAFASKEVSFFTDAVAGLSGNLGDKVMIAPIALSPADLPIMLMGLDNWLDMVLTDMGKAKDLIEKAGRFFLRLTNEFFESGASFVVIPSVFTNPSIITRDIAYELMDQLVKIFSEVKGPLIIHEGGARLLPFLEIYKEMPNVAGVVVSSKDNLLESRSLLDKNQVLGGNFQGPDLPTLTPEQIEAGVREICNLCFDDHNFIFASSGADIPFDTPIENIRKIKETIEGYTSQSKRPVCISCSIFRDEIRELKGKSELDIDFSFFSSMLHMKPDMLGVKMKKLRDSILKSDARAVLLYGDCCPNMAEIEMGGRIVRTTGINCIEIILGKEHYRALRKEGAFFLMPEWVGRWKEIFSHELKLDGPVAKELMMDLHSKIIYIDTGHISIPLNHLRDIEDYTGLKVEIVKAGTEMLKEELQKAIERLSYYDKKE